MTISPEAPPAANNQALAVDAHQLAAMLGISIAHVRRLDSAGQIPRAVRLGACVRWSVDEIRAWLLAGAPARDEWEERRKR